MITEEQRKIRVLHTGSSDMAAIVGADEYRNATDVWLEKTRRVDSTPENPAMRIGTLLEDDILQLAADELGQLYKPDTFVRDDLMLAANVDAAVVETNLPVEAKAVGRFVAMQWGDDGDDVPDRVRIQCHVHMICMGKDACHVAALFGTDCFRLYVIDFSQALADYLIECNAIFWDCVRCDTPPVDGNGNPIFPSLPVIERAKREPNKWADVDSLLVAQCKTLSARESAAKQAKEEAQSRLLLAMGDAEAARAGGFTVTYFADKRGIRSLRIKESNDGIGSGTQAAAGIAAGHDTAPATVCDGHSNEPGGTGDPGTNGRRKGASSRRNAGH